MDMHLSVSAARTLRDLVAEERYGISRGKVSFTSEQDKGRVLADLDELDRLAEKAS